MEAKPGRKWDQVTCPTPGTAALTLLHGLGQHPLIWRVLGSPQRGPQGDEALLPLGGPHHLAAEPPRLHHISLPAPGAAVLGHRGHGEWALGPAAPWPRSLPPRGAGPGSTDASGSTQGWLSKLGSGFDSLPVSLASSSSRRIPRSCATQKQGLGSVLAAGTRARSATRPCASSQRAGCVRASACTGVSVLVCAHVCQGVERLAHGTSGRCRTSSC